MRKGSVKVRCLRFHLLVLIVLSVALFPLDNVQGQNQRLEIHAVTNWSVSPSFKFDALCFLNILTGDPFYVAHYREEYARFEPQLSPSARTALANIKRKIKDENGNIVSAFLCLYFSATDDQTLDDMLGTLRDSETLERNLRQTPYFNRERWRLFRSVREDLRIVFSFLKTIRFDAYWQENILPRVQRKIVEIESDLPRYNIVPEIERVLGSALSSNQITIHLLYYSHPHGIRITGTRFLAATRWPFQVVAQNAVHEMLHPPFDLAHDRELRDAIAVLRRDEFLMDKIENHNPSFGYNSFEGFIEEDSVRALEQVVQERLGIARDARRRWREEDDGMHVFAVALYSLMLEERYSERREKFRDFLVRMVRSGRLAAGRIRPLYEEFYSRETRPSGSMSLLKDDTCSLMVSISAHSTTLVLQ